MQDDNVFMAQVQGGDKAAFEALVLRYRDAAVKKAVGLVGDPQLAEDIIQDCFADIYLKRAAYQPSFSFQTFLYALVRNKCVDALRKRRHAPVPYHELPEEASGETPESLFVRNYFYTGLQRALDNLAAEQRKMLLMYALDGMSYQQIAHSMGKSVAQIKITLFRIRQKLAPVKEEWS